MVVDFIKKQTDGILGRNSFSVGIDATKVVQSARISQRYKAIVGGSYPKHFISIEGMTKEHLQDTLDKMRSTKMKQHLAYEVKIAVITLQRVKARLSPYIFIAGRPQANNESNGFGEDFLNACKDMCVSINNMSLLNSAVDGGIM